MEPATEGSDNPPSFHGSVSLTDSPDTLSICSDALTDDLEIHLSPSGVRDAGDDHDDEGVMGRGGLTRRLKKQWSGDISLEGMLISAAAAAKKFKAERQKGINSLMRSQSADSPTGQINQAEDGVEAIADQHQENVVSQGGTSSDAVTTQYERFDIQGTIPGEQSPLLRKKSVEQSPCHSDDSESRHSGNEGGAVEEEALEK